MRTLFVVAAFLVLTLVSSTSALAQEGSITNKIGTGASDEFIVTDGTNERLKVNGQGTVTFSNETTQKGAGVQFNTDASSMLVVRGSVDSDGTILSQTGIFRVEGGGTGVYGVLFSGVFSSTPSCTCSVRGSGAGYCTVSEAENLVTITTWDADGNPAFEAFSLICLGPGTPP